LPVVDGRGLHIASSTRARRGRSAAARFFKRRAPKPYRRRRRGGMAEARQTA
jgi:hypothetical protein